MKLPKTVDIKGTKYKLAQFKTAPDFPLLGECDTDGKIIKIYPEAIKFNGDDILRVLAHEIAHGVLNENNLSTVVFDSTIEELIVRSFDNLSKIMAKVKLQVIKLNETHKEVNCE